EKSLSEKKLLDAKSKKEVEDRIAVLLTREREFAENSPMPPPELAEKGVYCTGDDCHQIRPQRERAISEVTPPKSSISAVWTVEGCGSGQGSGGGQAAIHFGDSAPSPSLSPQDIEEKSMEAKLAPKTPVKMVGKKSAATNGKNGASAAKSNKAPSKSSSAKAAARRTPAGKARR